MYYINKIIKLIIKNDERIEYYILKQELKKKKHTNRYE